MEADPKQPAKRSVLTHLLFYWIACLVLTAGLSFLAIRLKTGTVDPAAYGWALLVSAVNGFIMVLMHARSIGPDLTRFLLWSLIGNSFRIILLIIILNRVYLRSLIFFEPFFAGIFTGYWIFLAGEITALHTWTLKDFKTNERNGD